MKKSLFVLAILALILACASAAAEDTFMCGDFEYALLPSGDAELIRYHGADGAVTIPNDQDGHPITAVRMNRFYQFDPSSGGRVRDCAVTVAADHPYLATINGVLYGMSDRKLIYCPPSATGAFTVRQGVRQIGDLAFMYCKGLIGVSIPDSVTGIGEWAFAYCTGLSSVSIPDSVTQIGEWAFSYCAGLTALTIPNSVTVIPEHAFRDCLRLTSLTIPSAVTDIGKMAFYDCAGLTCVTLPEGLTAIGERAFCNCASLTAVTLPDSLTEIGEHAFDAETVSVSYDFSYTPLPGLSFTAALGSYAETWCADNGLPCADPGLEPGDRDDWLE